MVDVPTSRELVVTAFGRVTHRTPVSCMVFLTYNRETVTVGFCLQRGTQQKVGLHVLLGMWDPLDIRIVWSERLQAPHHVHRRSSRLGRIIVFLNLHNFGFFQ